jgi:hypothetical protein
MNSGELRGMGKRKDQSLTRKTEAKVERELPNRPTKVSLAARLETIAKRYLAFPSTGLPADKTFSTICPTRPDTPLPLVWAAKAAPTDGCKNLHVNAFPSINLRRGEPPPIHRVLEKAIFPVGE